jgi:hypothetical protein
VAVEAREGFWQMQSDTYLNWTGRYAATLFLAVLGRWDLATIYPWFCVLTVAATLVAARAAIGALSPQGTSQVGLAAAAATATVVFNGRLPSPTEAYFWMTSAITYQWAIIVYLVWLALLVGIVGGERPTPARRIVIAVLTALLPGFNEVLAPVVLLTLVGVTMIEAARTRRSDRFLLWLLCIAVALTAVSLAAPGNVTRSNSYPDIPSRHHLGFALAETARQTVRFLLTFGSYPLLWVAALAAWPWGPRLLPRGAPGIGAIAVGIPVALVYITLFPLYWEYGTDNYTGEGRTYNVTYFCFIAAVVWGVGRLLDEVSTRWSWLTTRLHRHGATCDVALALAVTVLMVTAPGTARALRVLPQAPEYHEAQHAREVILRAPRNRGRAIVVNAMHIKPDSLFWGAIHPDAGHWINSCVASYYGLASVRTPKPVSSD